MIKIDRGPVPATIKVYAIKNAKALDGITLLTKAEQEIELCIIFHTNPAHYQNEVKLIKDGFNFKIYKDSELAAELEKIFGKKCAYCESSFAHVTPRDIEHFRPKSEIDTGNSSLRPGYYWLACDWENLLVSCPDCNRARNHQVPGQPASMKLGKKEQFPLSDETRRVRSRGALNGEDAVRLLINPCIDDPTQHLTFDEQGLINPRLDAQGNPSQMGRTSITVYALQRKALVEERLKVLNQLKFAVREISYLAKMHNRLITLGASVAELAENAQQIQAVSDNIKTMFARNAPYLAMLREWITVSHARGDFNDLLQFRIDLTDFTK